MPILLSCVLLVCLIQHGNSGCKSMGNFEFGCDAGQFCAANKDPDSPSKSEGKCKVSLKGLKGGWIGGTCKRCPKGYFCDNGPKNKATCGKSNPTEVEKCQPGTYSNYGLTVCTHCRNGTYAENFASTVCTLCELGKYSAQNGPILSCTDCEIGKYQNIRGGVKCSDCQKGFVATEEGMDMCIPCDVGKYSERPEAECESCEPGKYASLDASSECKDCPAGYYSLEEAESCTACKPGSYSARGSSNCTVCDKGKYSRDYGSFQCHRCAPGKHSGTHNSSDCQDCPAGKTSDNNGTSCIECIAGRHAPQEASVDCSICSTGRYSEAGQKACSDCEPGTFNNITEASACRSCEEGSYTQDKAAVRCTLCDRGKYGDKRHAKACTDCSLGKSSRTYQFGAVTEEEACADCRAGKYATKPGECGECERGTASSVKGSKSISDCKECPPGFYADNLGSDKCTPCSVGYFSNATKTVECTKCAKGMTTVGKGAMNCTLEDCAPGHRRSTSDVARCEMCPAGKSSSAGEPCTSCKAGFYAPVEGMASCAPCRKGSYADERGSLGCTNCTAGRYAGSVGSNICRVCPPGTFCPSSGMETYLECPSGHYTSTSMQVHCSKCPQGTYQPDRATASCQICPAGTANSGTGSATEAACSLCPAGKYSASGAIVCTNCTLGTYQNQTGQTECLSCKSIGSTMTSDADRTGCESDKELEGLSSTPHGSIIDALFERGVALYGAGGIAVTFTAVAGVLQFKKEKVPDKLAQMGRMQVILKALLPGFSFGSDVFLITGMIRESPGTAVTMLLFRLLHLVVGVMIALCLYGPLSSATFFERVMEGSTSLRGGINAKFARENMPFICVLMMFCCCDVTMVQFMPWEKSRFYTESKGFPRFSVLQVCLATKVVQGLVATICQSTYMGLNTSLNDPTMSAQGKGLFITNILMSTINVVVGMLMLCLKENFLRQIESEENGQNAESPSAETIVNLHDIYPGSKEDEEGGLPATENPMMGPPPTATATATATATGAAAGGGGSQEGELEEGRRRSSTFTWNPLFGRRDSINATPADSGGGGGERRRSSSSMAAALSNMVMPLVGLMAPTPRNSLAEPSPDGEEEQGEEYEVDVEVVIRHVASSGEEGGASVNDNSGEAGENGDRGNNSSDSNSEREGEL